MTDRHSIAGKVAAYSTTLSPYPSSFNNDPVLYSFALAALMAISMYAFIFLCWMLRDLWRDRFLYHPMTPMFLFRLMVAIISFTAFIRCLPEVVYNTCYGEVTGDFMSRISMVRNLMNIIALPSVVGWMAIFYIIYPFVTLALKANRAFGTPRVDPVGNWHRFVRPAIILMSILVIAFLMAAAKGRLGHSG